jgi:hypothetical protein
MPKILQEKMGTMEDFEARQNAVGFFSVLLEVAMQHPELYKKVFNEISNETNRDTNSAGKA